MKNAKFKPHKSSAIRYLNVLLEGRSNAGKKQAMGVNRAAREFGEPTTSVSVFLNRFIGPKHVHVVSTVVSSASLHLLEEKEAEKKKEA